VEMWELGERPLDGLVGFSHEAVGRSVADHFVVRGARRFGFIGAALDRDRRAAERGRGFAEAIRSAGFAPPAEVSLADRANAVGGGEALQTLMSQAPETDAVFCSNDVMVLGALFACQRAGWSVPDRLRLCGFGDLDFAAASVPTLSTVRPPRREIGRCVADLLIRRFAGEGGTGEVIDLGFELVPRESS
jgi:LacI family gluconate utilization system Gnt-I transcriptional repressor